MAVNMPKSRIDLKVTSKCHLHMRDTEGDVTSSPHICQLCMSAFAAVVCVMKLLQSLHVLTYSMFSSFLNFGAVQRND